MPGLRDGVRRFLLALALALPAYVLTNESFQPFEERLHLEGSLASRTVTLTSTEPLFLELELNLRVPGEKPAVVVLHMNDTRITTIMPERLYVTQRAKPLILPDAIRVGENRLTVEIEGEPSATFGMDARLHNYYGTNPRFPRVFVVADESVAHLRSQVSLGRRAARFGTFCVVGLLLAWGIAKAFRRRSPVARYLLVLSPSIVLWSAVFYSLSTSLHVWLSLEALLVMSLVPFLITAGAQWALAHRIVVRQAAGVTLVTLVLLEIGLRISNYFSPSFIFYSDSYSRYRGQPGAWTFDFRLNSKGFNDIEYETSKPPHVAHRIVAIGDSVAFGVVPYRANYLTLIEVDLATDRSIEVINMGTPGTEPQDYLAILVNEGLAFDPDIVMVGFFIGNDFESSARKPYEHLHVTTLVHFLWQLWRAGTPATARSVSGVTHYDDAEPSFSENRFLEIEVDRSRIFNRSETGLGTSIAHAVGYLRQMRDISRRAGADFLVVLIPDEVQVNEELQETVARASRSTREQFDFRLPNRLLANSLTNEQIAFLDLLPTFEQAARQTRLYKPRDTHWNLAGNRLAAERIAFFLRTHVLPVVPSADDSHE